MLKQAEDRRIGIIGAQPDVEDVDRPSIGGRLTLLWRRMMENSFVRHNLLLFIGNMAASAFTFLYHPIVGHFLGAAKYGTVVSFGALALVFSLPTAVIPNLFNKFMADLTAQGRAGEMHYLLRRSMRLGIVIGIIVAIIFAALNPVLTAVFKVPVIYALLTSLNFVFAFSAPINWGAIQGRQQFAWFSVINFVSAVARAVLTTIALVIGWGINGTLGAGIVAGLLVYALSFVPLFDVFRVPMVRLPSIKPLFSYSLGATLALTAGLLLTNIDLTLAAPFLSKEDAGYYDALATIGRIVLFAGGSFAWAMFPKVAALHQQGRPHGALLGWTMAGVTALSLCVVGVFALFPSQLVTIIFHEPTAVAHQLFWYGVAMMFLASSNVLIGYFLALGRMAFVPFMLACCALQIIILSVHHRDIAQMVMSMVVTMAVLLGGLIVIYIAQTVRAGARAEIRPLAS